MYDILIFSVQFAEIPENLIKIGEFWTRIAKRGDCEHAIEHCPIFDEDRRKTKIRLHELGLRCDNIWALVKKAGGPMKDAIDPIEQKRKVFFRTSEVRKIKEKMRK